MVETALPVSYLNVLFNLAVVFLGWLATEFGIIAVKRLTEIRLRKDGRAPLIPEIDHDIWHANSGLYRAMKNRSPVPILVFFMISSLVFLEVFSEFGVDSSNFCKPRSVETKTGICASPYTRYGTNTKRVAAMAMAQAANWRFPESGALVREGFRKQFDGTESFHSDSRANKTKQIVLGFCKSSPVEMIPAGEITFTLARTSTGWSFMNLLVYIFWIQSWHCLFPTDFGDPSLSE